MNTPPSKIVHSNRDKSVDIAKGIGIILIVWGHTFGACPLFKEIHLFHVPLFFFLSGCFLKTNEKEGAFIYKKTRTLITPFLFFYTTSFAIKTILYYLNGGNTVNIPTYCSSLYPISTINYPLWFIVCLFVSSVIYFSIKKQISSTKVLISVTILLSIVGYILARQGVRLPLYLTQSLLVLIFIYIGDVYYKNKHQYSSKQKIIVSILSTLFLIIGIICHTHTYIEELSIDSNYLLFFFPALGGSILTLQISEYLSHYKWSSFLATLGFYSLFIFAIHANMGYLNGLISKLSSFSYQLFTITPPIDITHSTIWGIFKVIITIPICCILGYILKKHLSFLFECSPTDYFYKKLNK